MPAGSINLRLRFIMGLVLFAAALGICISIIMYFHYNSIMASEISQRSRMLLAQSDAVQDYVKTVLRPEMFKTLPRGRFILQAMSSSYISRKIMERLNRHEASDYHYRRVAIKPRNPASAPDGFETRLIAMFSDNRKLNLWEDNTDVNGREYHLVARPVTYTRSCMQCHGDPSDAPEELKEIYGDHNGFHYLEGEVGGVVVAGFPVDLIKVPAKELTLQYLSLYLLGIMCFACLISIFFDRLVMKNLHHLTQIFKTRFEGHQEQSIIERLGRHDEIEGLVEGIEELAVCLSDARQELEDYAQNLEMMVQDRTRALKTKALKHLGDARLFVSLLSRFGSSRDPRQLISGLLDSVGKRYNADQAVYHCTVISDNSYAWKPSTESVKPISQEIKDLLWKDEIRFEGSQVFIPVKTPESHWGILNISWGQGPTPEDDLDPAILLALGQQMAILVENIHAFSNIRSQHGMLQSIFKGISDPLMLLDEDCRIIIANDGACAIIGKGSREVKEDRLKSFLRNGKPTSSILAQVMDSGCAAKHEVRTPDQRFFDVELYPLPPQSQTDAYPQAEHAKTRMVLYARDITLERQMLERMQQAERLSAIGKISAGIAHEINNPLGVIQIYADLVKDAVDDPATREDLDIILKHTRSAKNVVQNLLNLARPKKSLSGTCNLNAVIRSELEVFRAQVQTRNITVETSLSPNLPRIRCDAAIAEQILTNLWINAVDALQESGDRISLITGTADDNMVKLTMEDNGPGIDEAIAGQIFDPFFSTKEVGKGTGLGLSVVFGFVTELGGRITVDNISPTRFNIFFPISPEEAP